MEIHASPASKLVKSDRRRQSRQHTGVWNAAFGEQVKLRVPTDGLRLRSLQTSAPVTDGLNCVKGLEVQAAGMIDTVSPQTMLHFPLNFRRSPVVSDSPVWGGTDSRAKDVGHCGPPLAICHAIETESICLRPPH